MVAEMVLVDAEGLFADVDNDDALGTTGFGEHSEKASADGEAHQRFGGSWGRILLMTEPMTTRSGEAWMVTVLMGAASDMATVCLSELDNVVLHV